MNPEKSESAFNMLDTFQLTQMSRINRARSYTLRQEAASIDAEISRRIIEGEFRPEEHTEDELKVIDMHVEEVIKGRRIPSPEELRLGL